MHHCTGDMPLGLCFSFLHITIIMLLSPTFDPMGQAILDYASTGHAGTLRVLSSMFDDDEIPVPTLFRTELQMPPLERMALNLCRGHVLDVGAGAGCHSLALQDKGLDVCSIDISPLSTQARTLRGVKDAHCTDFYDQELDYMRFDTIILLMNGLGIAGTLSNLPSLLNRCKVLLAPDGRVLADSSDLRYVFEDEEGNFDWDPAEGYYGEVDYQMIYKQCKGKPFDWLYVDFDTLQRTAQQCGLAAHKVADGEHYDYLAELRAL